MDAPNPAAAEGPRGPSARAWCVRVDEALANEKAWRARAAKIVRIYRGELSANGGTGTRSNMLHANTSILLPAIFQQAPNADVRRRFAAPNEVADAAADVLQKGANATLEACDAGGRIRRAAQEMLLPGRGQTRVRWVPTVRPAPVPHPLVPGAPLLGPDGKPVMAERKVWEEVAIEHVYWEDFLHEPARDWDQVGWVAFRHALTKGEMVERFGEKAAELLADKDAASRLLSHDLASAGDTEMTDGLEGAGKRALVWECWDRESRTVTFVAHALKVALLTEDDPLGLEGFFPCPEPLFAAMTTDQLVPVPEFSIYQDTAAEIDRLTERIDAIVERLKVRGAFNGSIDELASVLEGADGEMVAIDGVAMEQQLGNAIWMLPLEQLVQVAAALYQAREQAKQLLYEITGISDILRGSSAASETATAQRIKGNFGTLRLNDRRKAVEKHGRDLVRLIAEIMASKFDGSTLAAMTGEEVPPQLVEFLRSDALLWCLVDVESDSTVAPDEAAEQEAVAKLVAALNQLIQGIGPLIQAGAVPLPIAVEIIKLALKPFKGSRDVVEMLGQLAQSPEAQAAVSGQGEGEGDGSAEAAGQVEQMRLAADAQRAQLDMAKTQQEGALVQAKGQVEAVKLQQALVKARAEQIAPARAA